jgi:hypothetical protein
MGDPEIRDIPVEKQRDALDRVKAYAGSQGFEITGRRTTRGGGTFTAMNRRTGSTSPSAVGSPQPLS